jgi:hypothetical protein
VVTWIGAPTTLDGMGKAVLGGMVKPGIGAPATEGTQRQPSVVVTAIDLGLIAPVVPATGGAGRDEERGYIGRGWSTRGSAGLVEDRGIRLVVASGGAGRDRAVHGDARLSRLPYDCR